MNSEIPRLSYFCMSWDADRALSLLQVKLFDAAEILEGCGSSGRPVGFIPATSNLSEYNCLE